MAFMRNWDSKTCIWTGMAMFALMTLALTAFRADKELIMAGFGLTGQLVAGLLTYVNSHKNEASNETKPDDSGTTPTVK
jgi:hypothetical protein